MTTVTRLLICALCLAVPLVVLVLLDGKRGAVLFARTMVSWAMMVTPIVIADQVSGRTAGWCVMPFGVVAYWLGQTPLGMLNFLVLQWFGVRLARVRQGVVFGDDPSCLKRVRWELMRWIWPLTGWVSSIRYITRRRRNHHCINIPRDED